MTPATPIRLLIIDQDPAVAELERLILATAGYRATAILCGPDSLRAVKSRQPNVILLGLGPHPALCGWQLLAELRSDKDTQGIPLLVVSNTESLLEDASRNFNVRQGLIKPFDITDLETGIRAAITRTPLLPHPARPNRPATSSADVADLIARESENIMARWVQRVLTEGAAGSHLVSVRDLMDNIATWLMGVISVLRYGPDEVNGQTAIREKLHQHIVHARARGVTLSQLIRQFEILRDEVWSAVERQGVESASPRAVFALTETLNRALATVTTQAVAVFESPLPSEQTAGAPRAGSSSVG